MFQCAQLPVRSHTAAFVGPLIQSHASVTNSKNHLISLWEISKKPFLSHTLSGGGDWMITNGAAGTSKICHRPLTALINSWSLIHPSPVMLCVSTLTCRPAHPLQVFRQHVSFLFQFGMPLIPMSPSALSADEPLFPPLSMSSLWD